MATATAGTAGMPPGLTLSIPLVIRCEGCGAAAEEKLGYLVMIHGGLCPVPAQLRAQKTEGTPAG